MKRLIVMAILVAALILLSLAGEPRVTAVEQEEGEAPERSLAAPSPIQLPSARQSKGRPGAPASADALKAADAFVEELKSKLRFQSHHHLQSVSFQTPLKTVIKYSVYDGEIPLLGLGLEVEVDSKLQVTGFRNDYRPLLPGPKSIPQADTLLQKISPRYEVVEKDLSASAPVYYVHPASTQPEAAYVLRVRDRARKQALSEMIFRASDGQLLGRSRARYEF